MMKVVKVSFHEADIIQLTAQARAAGLNRAELIRERVLGRQDNGAPAPVRTAAQFNDLVSQAYHQTHGAFSRSQVEALVAFVFTRLVGPLT